jgi:hypothetical protein
VVPGGGPLARPRDLANPDAFEVRLRTPSGTFEARHRLEAMKGEFLASDRRWLDDAFIAEMTALAERLRALPTLPEGLERSRHRLEPIFFCPAFAGTYVIEEPGALSASATTWVLASEPAESENDAPRSSRGRRVELRMLTPESAIEALVHHGVARVDLAAWTADSPDLARLRHWLAVDTCLTRDPGRTPALLGAREVTEALSDETRLPPVHRELEQVIRRLRSERGRIHPDALDPLNRLRLAALTSSRAPVRRLVRHVQAFLDPVDLGSAFRFAPDVFFARLPRLSAPRREYLAAWLAENSTLIERESERAG